MKKKKIVKYLLWDGKTLKRRMTGTELKKKERKWIEFFLLICRSISTLNMISEQILSNCRRNMYIMWKFTWNFHAFNFESICIGSAAYMCSIIIHSCYTVAFVWWGECMKIVISDHIVRFVRPKKSQVKWHSLFVPVCNPVGIGFCFPLVLCICCFCCYCSTIPIQLHTPSYLHRTKELVELNWILDSRGEDNQKMKIM